MAVYPVARRRFRSMMSRAMTSAAFPDPRPALRRLLDAPEDLQIAGVQIAQARPLRARRYDTPYLQREIRTNHPRGHGDFQVRVLQGELAFFHRKHEDIGGCSRT